MEGSKVTWRDSASVASGGAISARHNLALLPQFNQGRAKRGERRTSCPPRANGPVTRTTRIATDVPDPRVQQSLPFKRLAEEVLDTPEAASGYGALLRVGWEVGGGAAFGVEGHAGGGGEGAEEASEEIGHC